FSREVALPITLAMLLDTSGSEQDMLASIQDAGSQFIARIIRKGDEALVMSFDANVDLLSDFTDERSQLERVIHKTRINVPDQGARVGNPGPIGSLQITGTALYDAIYLACGEKLDPEAGHKIMQRAGRICGEHVQVPDPRQQGDSQKRRHGDRTDGKHPRAPAAHRVDRAAGGAAVRATRINDVGSGRRRGVRPSGAGGF